MVMGFGLDIKNKSIEVSKENWVEYKGIFYPPRTAAALKAAETRRRNDLYTKYKTKTKEEQREIILDLIEKANNEWMEYNHSRYTDEWKRNIILLESPKCLFLKEYLGRFQKNNYIPNQIWIPNNEEFDKFKCATHCNACKGNIWGEHQIDGFSSSWNDRDILLLNCSYLSFVGGKIKDDCEPYTYRENHRLKRFSVCMIWADYCGAFSTHRDDIKATFYNLLLGNHSYYAITFCTRDRGKNKLKKYRRTDCIIAVNDFVSKIAREYGYVVELLPESGMYKPFMFSAIFLVKYEVMEKAKEEITKLLDEYRKTRIVLDHKIKDLDNIVYRLNVNGTQCSKCGRYFKDIDKHSFFCNGY